MNLLINVVNNFVNYNYYAFEKFVYNDQYRV